MIFIKCKRFQTYVRGFEKVARMIEEECLINEIKRLSGKLRVDGRWHSFHWTINKGLRLSAEY